MAATLERLKSAMKGLRALLGSQQTTLTDSIKQLEGLLKGVSVAGSCVNGQLDL